MYCQYNLEVALFGCLQLLNQELNLEESNTGDTDIQNAGK